MAMAAFSKATESGVVGCEVGQSCVVHDLSTSGNPGQLCGQHVRKLVKVWHSIAYQLLGAVAYLVMVQCFFVHQDMPSRKALLIFNCNNNASNTGINKGVMPDIISLACSLEILRQITSLNACAENHRSASRRL